MKNLILAVAMLTASLTFTSCSKNCEKPVTEDSCIDESKINTDAACYALYDPVCGCDGKTYGNDCEARKAGVKSFTKGKCDKETDK